eukprot:jgi/Galph1/4357/GphlegSOOS_G3009.1
MEELGTLPQLFGSSSEAVTFINFLNTLREKDSSNDRVIRIFELKSTTSFLIPSFGAILAVQRALVPQIALEFVTTDNIPYVVLNYRKLSEFIGLALFENGAKLQVWSKTKDGKNFELVSEGSPANYDSLECYFQFDDLNSGIMDNVSSPLSTSSQTLGNSLSVKFTLENGQRKFGAAFYEIGQNDVLVGEFYEDEAFSVLENVIVHLLPREVFYCPSDLSVRETNQICDMLSKCNILQTKKDRKDFEATTVQRDITKLLGNVSIPPSILEQAIALQALGVLIKCCGLVSGADEAHGDHLRNIHRTLKPLELSDYMKLDVGCIRGLDIVSLSGEQEWSSSTSRKDSLYAVLNRTRTAMGSRLLKRWLLTPLRDKQEINRRLDVVENLILNAVFRTELRDIHLKLVPDLTRICRRFERVRNASLQHVVRLYQLSVRLPYLENHFRQHVAEQDTHPLLKYLTSLSSLHRDLERFEELVETCVDLDQVQNFEYVVNPKIDESLFQLKQEKDVVLGEFAVLHENICNAVNIKSEKLKLERKDSIGFYFRLSRKDERLIRGNPTYIIVETRKDGIRFVTKTMRHLNEKYFIICADYEKKQEEMKRKIIQVVSSYVLIFENISFILAELDVLATLATVAVEAPEPYCRPCIDEPGTGINVQGCRHPIVEENLDGKSFIANDCMLQQQAQGNDKYCGRVLMIVTGPNMGGKSTYIRTIGVITLMAHVGCFVPAKHARIALTDRILCRVGSTDYQLYGLSTFMAEMLETSSILRLATSSSLIIIDELGRGTSTEEGFGLAFSIAEYIVKRIGCPCLFATHFHELTSIANEFSLGTVQNVHVSAEPHPESQKLQFLYRVSPGVCDRSFGIHVAEFAGFPESVIEDAKQTAAKLENFGFQTTNTSNTIRQHDHMKDKEHGLDIMKHFVLQYRQINNSSMCIEEKQSAIRKLREEACGQSNAYVQTVIKSNI